MKSKSNFADFYLFLISKLNQLSLNMRFVLSLGRLGWMLDNKNLWLESVFKIKKNKILSDIKL